MSSAPPPQDPDKLDPTAGIAWENIRYRQWFPWLRLLDLFWIALDLQKLVLAVAAVVLLALGNLLIFELPFATAEAQNPAPPPASFLATETTETWPWQQSAELGAPPSREIRSWMRVFAPIDSVSRPAQILIRPQATWPQLGLATTQFLWALIVWSIFGGAITRIAAVRIATDRKLNVLDALKFSGRRFLSYLSAPLIPLAGVGILWLLCLAGGQLARIPTAGPWIVGALWGIGLLFGVLMALALIGVAAGWPLMFATVSVEGSDALDGLTRSYGYVFAKPAYYLFLAAATALCGAIAIFLVAELANFAAYLTAWAGTWGTGAQNVLDNRLTAIWLALLATLVVAFAHSYFWSAVTMIYFLLRRTVDANDFSEVYLEQPHGDELLPWAIEEPRQPSVVRPAETSTPDDQAAPEGETPPPPPAESPDDE